MLAPLLASGAAIKKVRPGRVCARARHAPRAALAAGHGGEQKNAQAQGTSSLASNNRLSEPGGRREAAVAAAVRWGGGGCTGAVVTGTAGPKGFSCMHTFVPAFAHTHTHARTHTRVRTCALHTHTHTHARAHTRTRHHPPPQVRFSTKSVGRDAAHVAARAIKAVSHSLEHADMSDVIAGRAVSSAVFHFHFIEARAAAAARRRRRRVPGLPRLPGRPRRGRVGWAHAPGRRT